MSERKDNDNQDDAAVLEAYHEALLDGSSVQLGDKSSSLGGALRCIRALERSRQFEQDGDGQSYSDNLAELTKPPTEQEIGRFRILRKLGQGGNGVVFLARDPDLDREIALKVPTPDALLSPEFVKRFEREGRLAANLRHPHIVRIFETGAIGPISYIASSYCNGPSLSQWLSNRDSPVSSKVAADLVRVLAEAVHHAHTRGVLHRDIKPSNILFDVLDDQELSESTLSGAARLTDFGLAKRIDDETVTAPASILGTPAYMSPEQAEGNLEEIGTHTDVFSLGCVLYELLLGKSPFRRETPLATLSAVRSGVLDPPSQWNRLPRDLRAIIECCLAKRPSNRYDSAEALAGDLHAFANGRSVSVRPITGIQRLIRCVREHPLVSILAISTGTLVVAVAVLSSVAAMRLHSVNKQITEEAANANAVTRFLTDDIISQSSPYTNPDHKLTLLDALRNAEQKLQNFRGKPTVEAEIRTTLARSYLQLAEHDRAEFHMNRAYVIYENEDDTRAKYQVLFLQGQLAYELGEVEKATTQFESLLKTPDAEVPAGDRLFTETWLAHCHLRSRRKEEALELYRSRELVCLTSLDPPIRALWKRNRDWLTSTWRLTKQPKPKNC